MKKLDRLIKEARESCEFRGHKLTSFDKTDYEANAQCIKCGMNVFVTKFPMPNETEIYGEAVALNCK